MFVAVNGAGCVMRIVVVFGQPLLSVTVQVYVIAESPVAVAAVPPVGVQENVYAPTPPVAVTVAEPLAPPLHETFVEALIEAVGPPELEIVTVVDLLQLFASVTEIVYIPARTGVVVVAAPPEGAQE